MKKNYIKLLIIEILMLLIVVFNTFISNVFTATSISVILTFGITFLGLILLVGFEKNKSLFQIDILQIIFIFSVTYIVLTYIFGFFFGFSRSPYSLELFKILKNLFPAAIIILLQELIRYIIISKGKGNKLVVALLILVFILFDISMGIGHYSLNSGMDIFEAIGLLFIPSVARNLLLTYVSLKNGYKPTLLYRGLFELTIYILPLFPNMGIYFESILNIVFPVLLFLKLNSFYGKIKPIVRRPSKFKTFLFWVPTAAVLATIVILVSGIFKIYAMAIGSGSMTPIINKGDAIIVEKLTDEQFRDLKIGDVIAYEYDNRIIVHRIINIEKKSNNSIYHTKGDYNDKPDNYDIEKTQIKGIVRYKIPYIGYPSVWLSELLN